MFIPPSQTRNPEKPYDIVFRSKTPLHEELRNDLYKKPIYLRSEGVNVWRSWFVCGEILRKALTGKLNKKNVHKEGQEQEFSLYFLFWIFQRFGLVL